MTDDKGDFAQGAGVMVFSPIILPVSQTFVRDHVVNLKRYKPVLCGLKPVSGLPLDGVDVRLAARSTLSRLLLYFFGRSAELSQVVRQERIQLVHAHFADGAALIAKFAKREKLPLIVTLHGADVLRRRTEFAGRRWLKRNMMAYAQCFLAVSDYMMRRALALGYPANRILTHYLGVPSGEVPGRASASSIPTILFVGRIVEKKGITFLLSAVERLMSRNLSFRTRIVGDGPLIDPVRERIVASGLNVELLGSLTPDRVRHEMAEADIFCMPSTSAADGDNEGLGLVYLEAQLAGLPVVAFDQGPVPEAVIQGETAVLVPDKDIEALAEALADLIQNSELRQRMGSKGRQFVQDKFDIGARTEELERIYDRLIAT